MAQTKVNFQGKAKWIKLFRPNDYGKWSLDLYLDEAQVQKFRDLKVKTHLRKDDDGYYVSFSRPVEKAIRGKMTAMQPPIVTVMHEGKEEPLLNVNISNGSDVTISCEYYGYKPPGATEKLYAIRLYAVRVDNLIPFTKDSFTEEEKEAVDILAKTGPLAPQW